MGSPLAIAEAILLMVISACHANPETTTSQGMVRGITLTTNHDRNISGFLGIPFAQPPIGNLRFKNPVAADSWNGTYDATKDASMCPQLNNNKVVGDEDCLYLNVYTPETFSKDATGNTTNLLPVMFYIHGGRFIEGSSDSAIYGPEFIMDQDVVMVVTNYRVGILGFLSTGDANAPGNFGLKDQVLALRWVQENIRHFMGDPENVTIFGQSAGGASVLFLTLSDLANGLFHRYIIQSGVVNHLRTHRENPSHVACANKLGEHLGCPTNSSSLLISCLREVDVSTMVDTEWIFYVWETYPRFIFVPTAEPDLEGAFLTENPLTMAENGKMKDLPGIVGTVRDEGLVITAEFYTNETLFETLFNDIDKALPYVLNYYDKVDDVAKYTSAIKAYYFNDLTADRTILLANLTDLVGDMFMFYETVKLLEQQVAFVQSPSYFYSFEYRGTLSYTYKFFGGNTSDFGISHADDLIYLFSQRESVFAALEDEMTESDMEMVDTFVQLWTSFATNGTPRTNRTDNWEAYSLHNSYLQLGSGSDVEPIIASSFLEARMQFWKEFTASINNSASGAVPCFLTLIVSLLNCTFVLLHIYLRAV